MDDGSEYCETEGRKMEDKDQGGIGRNREKPGRIKKVIMDDGGCSDRGWPGIL